MRQQFIEIENKLYTNALEGQPIDSDNVGDHDYWDFEGKDGDIKNSVDLGSCQPVIEIDGGYKLLKEEYPWACVIEDVEGGYMAFESWTDYNTWKGQV